MKGKTKELRMTYWLLLTAFALLLVIGTVNVFSSTFVDDRAAGNVFSHLIRQAVVFGIGLIPSIFVYKHDYEFWHRHTRTIVVITVVLLLAVLTAGVVVNGARRWIGVAGLTFQPSELAKLTSILYVATILTPLLTKHKRIDFLRPLSSRKQAPFWQRIAWIPHPALWAPLVMTALVFKQPDAGTAAVILVIPIVMLAVSGASIKRMKIPMLLIVVVAVVAMMAEPYRRDRITAWLDPWSYEKTLGYQTVQSLIAIGSGGFMGQGLGEGISKFSYLPEAHTDFAFAVLAQEWGMRGTVTMLVLFCIIIYFGAVTAWSCRSKFGMLLSLGVTLYFGGQGFINIGMVSGLLPVVGVPLPFISYGGTHSSSIW
jgi:cell division protein FtsW